MSASARISFVLVALSVAALAAGIWFGPVAIADPFAQDDATRTIVWNIRMPRALTA